MPKQLKKGTIHSEDIPNLKPSYIDGDFFFGRDYPNERLSCEEQSPFRTDV